MILDIQRDKYLSLGLADSSPLSNLVLGWPISSAEAAAKPISEDEQSVVDLLNKRILTTDRSLGKPATQIDFPLATQEILKPRSVFADHSKPRYKVQRRHRTAFFAAVARARFLTRFCTLEQTVNRAARRREKSIPKGEPDWESLRVLVSNFRWLRPWGFASKDRCLFSSLVLIEYLTSFDMYPRWVFGVKASPFEAHSWVAADTVVLNDYLTKVNQYTPILSV